MNKITVLFFATFRDKAGTNRTEIEIPDGTTIEGLREFLVEKYPGLESLADHALASINREYAFPDQVIPDGAEVAWFPPVSGGSEPPTVFSITEDEIDLNALLGEITLPSTGASCFFTGMVRGITTREDPHETEYLEYEAYTPMAEEKMRQVAAEMREKWPRLEGVAIVQRVGRLMPGTPTILIACTAGHRDTGVFEAARYGIDRLKQIVPVWKKEVSPDGEEWVREITSRPRGSSMTAYACLNCGEPYSGMTRFRCPSCGGTYGIPDGIQYDRNKLDHNRPGIWRYRHSFGLPESAPDISLGEGNTPLVEAEISGHPVWLKLESANPTGSYKDRLAAVMVSLLVSHKVTSAVEDSSGNAGAAFSAYSARAGIQAKVFVPESAAGPKRAQIERFGAEVVAVPGLRQAAADAVLEEAAQGAVYASHANLPHGLTGIATIAYELADQLGGVPSVLFAPVGNGGLLLGVILGFQALLDAGEIDRLPKFIGVQAADNAPLWSAANRKPFQPGSTIAGGIAVSNPVRSQELLDLYRRGVVDFVTVSEEAILDGKRELAHQGVDAEPTSAVIVGAFRQMVIAGKQKFTGPTVAVISGHGLKA